jgi:cytochrome c556
MGGRGEYRLTASRAGGEINYRDESRGRVPVQIWESDQGLVAEERSLCGDMERVLAIARYFAELAELHPGITWITW